jgi:hypothetical protein
MIIRAKFDVTIWLRPLKYLLGIINFFKEKFTMRRILFTCSLLVLLTATASAQKSKPWTEWTVKDAQKVLTDSAWAQTQTELTDAPPTSGGAVTKTQSSKAATLEAAEKTESAEKKQNASLSTNYHVAFLTAKPVRQAFIRMIELQRPEMPAEKVAELRTFVDRDFGDYVVVTLLLDGTDMKRLGPAKQEISGADPEALKTSAYLERKDGKRLSLMDYRPPSQDGMGAKFIFPRKSDGQPFIDASSGELRVIIQLGKSVKVNRRFKVAEMMYDGKLEY